MQKNVRLVKNLTQRFLRNKTGKQDLLVDLQLASERLQFFQERAFAGDGDCRSWITSAEFSKGLERCGQSLLFNQATCLHQSPLAVFRKRALPKWKLR